MRSLNRLLKPKTIALFGGGWAANVIEQLQKSGFAGEIWPLHPRHDEISGYKCFRSIDDLPSAPDASFIGVNRKATIEVVRALNEIGAGGATCFASGFLESEAEGAGGADLQRQLIEAAGDMPILGPNCYGILNYLDNVTLWPDQHGGLTVEKGVAIIAQSSNIAINMTMQKRGLPIAYVVAAGNQAQLSASDIASQLLDDERVTAIGLYLEGLGDVKTLEALVQKANAMNKSIVALKIGRSEKAQMATISHTASLAGKSAASAALFARLGIIEVQSIATFIETLKLLNMGGQLSGNAICSISCSGGEASLMADMALGLNIEFRDFSKEQKLALKNELGPIVTISNPLDYHTFIWGDVPRMTRVFEEVMRDRFDLCVFVLDLPRNDLCDPSSYDCALEAIIDAKQKTGARVALLASLPENLDEVVIARFASENIVVLNGMAEGLEAIDNVVLSEPITSTSIKPLVLAGPIVDGQARLIHENKAKALLLEYGLKVPRSQTVVDLKDLEEACSELQFPLALKGLGVAHKSEANAVAIDLKSVDDVLRTANKMTASDGYLLEEMAEGSIAELLIGIMRDTTGMLMLTIGAGGVLTEILQDSATLLLPSSRDEIQKALRSLKAHKIISGYRGKPGANEAAILDAIDAICAYAIANKDRVIELDVNPLIARVDDAIAVDALIRIEE